jgi:transposase-like protein
MGLTQSRNKKQKYYCYSCEKNFLGPYVAGRNTPTMNSSGITEEEPKKVKTSK